MGMKIVTLDKDQTELATRVWDAERSTPNDLRKAGLAVAIHNDYRLEGQSYTFWLMTIERDGQILGFKGEGATDQIALDIIRAAWAKLTDKRHHAPMCPANHYHGMKAPTYSCTCGAK